jgi:hypothetical protein
MMRLAALAALAPLLLCGGCNTPLQEPLSPRFGAAVASLDVQIAPPDPSTAPPAGSGAVGAAAIARYQSGRVIQPNSADTSQIARGIGAPAAGPGAAP